MSDALDRILASAGGNDSLLALAGVVHVRGYTQKDGDRVRSYTRGSGGASKVERMDISVKVPSRHEHEFLDLVTSMNGSGGTIVSAKLKNPGGRLKRPEYDVMIQGNDQQLRIATNALMNVGAK